MELLVLLAVAVGFFAFGRRISNAERRIAALEGALSGALVAQPASVVTPSPPVEPSPPEAAPPVAPTLPIEPERIEPPIAEPAPAGTWRSPAGIAGATGPAIAASPAPTPPRRGFEETLGSRWAVWVGGLALALGGVFLVRYSIEQDLIGPRLRVAFGLAFALALLAAGEWLRRRERPAETTVYANANLPAILTAAGTCTAFATAYAAYGLYGLIGPGPAFILLGLIAVVTMAAATLHGPALAGLGLAGALGAPLLVETDDPNPVVLVAYLVFVAGSAYAVARLRLWRWLAISAAAGSLLWGIGMLVGGIDANGALLAHIVLQLALALLFLVVDPYRGVRDAESRIDRMVAAVLFAFAVLAILATDDLGQGSGRTAYAALVITMMVAAAFVYPAAAPGAAAAAFIAAALLLLWPLAGQIASEPETLIRDLPGAPRPEAISTFLTGAIVLNLLVALPALYRAGRSAALPLAPAAWLAGAATLGPLASLVIAYWHVTAFDRSIPFAIGAAGLALAYAAVSGWLKRREEAPAARLALGAAASASVAALAAGLTFAFDRGVLTVALALSALGTAFVARRVGVPALRYVVAALGIAIAARLAWDPSVVRGPVGPTPIVNWLLWGYGVPALALGLAARELAADGRDRVVDFVESLSLVFGFLLVFLEIRHALHAGDPFAQTSDHLEAGLVVTEALGFTLLAVRLDLAGRGGGLYRWASLLLGGLSIVGAAVTLLVIYNPLLSDNDVRGGAIFNSLAPAYLLPALLAAAIAQASVGRRPAWFVRAAACLALVLELAYACLEVRVLFHGSRTAIWHSTSDAELWCYTAVLVANGVVLLALGFLVGSRMARLASAACIAVATLKVFLVDLSALEGLARALSFVALGLALVGIGFVYQRLLARGASRA